MREYGAPRLYVRVAIIGIWSLLVGLVTVIVAAWSLTSISEGSTGATHQETKMLSFVGLLAGVLGSLFDAGLVGIAIGLVLLGAGVHYYRGVVHSMRSSGRVRSRRHYSNR